jgi:hypothetical protein
MSLLLDRDHNTKGCHFFPIVSVVTTKNHQRSSLEEPSAQQDRQLTIQLVDRPITFLPKCEMEAHEVQLMNMV